MFFQFSLEGFTFPYLYTMLDYLVVGLGLAGISFCETVRRHNKSFMVFNDRSQTSSRVAGGIYNPVILKRFTLSWRADEQLPVAVDFYAALSTFLGVQFDEKLNVLRKFASIEEQNSWFEASEKNHLGSYLATTIVENNNKCLSVPYNFGKVVQTGKLNTSVLIEAYTKWLNQENQLYKGTFNHSELKIHSNHVSYQGYKAKNIVFAEGFGLQNNPYFNYLPMQGSKGEYLIIKAADLKERSMIKSSFFLIPLGNDLYKVGATYNRGQKDNNTTEEARNEICKKLDSLLDCPYTIIGQEAGIRPTIKDRRPLVGKHPVHDRLWMLNGLGSHGVLIGPWASHALYNRIEFGVPLLKEMDLQRFTMD